MSNRALAQSYIDPLLSGRRYAIPPYICGVPISLGRPIGAKPEEKETRRTSGEAVTFRMLLRLSVDEWNVVEGVYLLYEFLGAGAGIACIRPGPQSLSQ